MADEITKKISIDVEVNTDGQQQINNYKTAFDNLRTTIAGLANPLSNLSTSISSFDKDITKLTASVDKLNSKNQDLNNIGDKVKGKVTELISSFFEWSDKIKKLTGALAGMEAELSAGLSILITFLPEIVNWASSLLKGKEAVNQAKLSINAMNNALENTDYSNAIEQLNQVKINVGLARKGFLDKRETLQQYNNTIGKTIGVATDLNKAEALIVKNGASYIKMTLLKASAQMALQDAAKKAYEAQQANLKSDDDSLTFMDKVGDFFNRMGSAGEGAPGTISVGAQADKEKKEKAKQRRKEAIDDANKQKDALLAIAFDFEKQAGTIAKQSGLDFFNGEIVPPRSTKPRKRLRTAADDDNPTLRNTSIDDSQKTPPADYGRSGDNVLAKDPVGGFKLTLIQENADKAKDIQKTTLQQIEEYAKQSAGKIASDAFSILSNSIKQQSEAKIAGLEKDKALELSNKSLTSAQRLAIEQKYKKQEGQVKAKAFKEEQEASIAQAVINGALAITKAEAQTGTLGTFVIPGIIAETAAQIAKIATQKPPAYAKGGLHYTSDGRGGVLPGYSRTDNTNAYLRSGEGIVVSEAMRAPWARNLVSAINVGFGGRDFSITNPGRGYAVGGIFTDGGDANRYYNQPVTDQKNLANTIAYQMINNFPPVYVDVKDVNNQQNILAQTINRVNL